METEFGKKANYIDECAQLYQIIGDFEPGSPVLGSTELRNESEIDSDPIQKGRCFLQGNEILAKDFEHHTCSPLNIYFCKKGLSFSRQSFFSGRI